MITYKNWDGKKVTVNLDTRRMTGAAKTSDSSIQKSQELSHNFLDSDFFSIAHLNHAFHQFELGDESKDLLEF